MLTTMIKYFTTSVCVFCSQKAHRFANLCEECLQSLPILSQNCYQCARQLTNAEKIRCGKCLQHPPPFDVSFALFSYEEPIIKLIHDLKFNHQLQHAKLLGTLLTHAIGTDWYHHQPLPDLILPVPLHPSRLKVRGFNQALEIARPIHRKLAIPLDIIHMKRVRATLPQTMLSAEERKKNLRGAFKTSHRYDHLTIALLDDVVTTGTTITAISKLLKVNGAKSVHIWCCARRHIALPAKTIYSTATSSLANRDQEKSCKK